MIFVDYGVTEDCQNLEDSYGCVCVKCNRCGRFDKEVAKDGCSKDE